MYPEGLSGEIGELGGLQITDWFNKSAAGYNNVILDNGTLNSSGGTTVGKKGATIVSPVIMFMTGLIGNTLALIVLYRTKTEIRRTMFYTLVAGLAWTDITGQVLTSPISIYTYINGLNWAGGEQLCKFNGFIMGCFGLSTPCIVCAMAVERFLAIKCPFFYSKYCTRSMARGTIVLLWGIVLLVSILPLMGFGQYSLQYPGTWCFLDFHTKDPVMSGYGYLYAGLNLVIILIMTGCNIFVAATLLKVRFMRKYSLSSNCDHCGLPSDEYQVCNSSLPLKRKQQHAVQMQMIWLMCAITTVFAVCWAPLMIQIVRTLATGENDYIADLLGVRLASINQILDPWLYILVRRSSIQRIARYCKKVICFQGNRSSEATNHRPPRLRLYPPPNDLVADTNADNHVRIRIQVKDDIVGLYHPCPHCANRRRRDAASNLSVAEVPINAQQLPDVMGSIDSHHSDAPSLPDVTPEGSVSRAQFSVGTHMVSQEGEPNFTSGYYDTDSEPIYVDVFLLPRDKLRSTNSTNVDSCLQAEQIIDHGSQTMDSIGDTSVFGEAASTSGVFSGNSQYPRRQFRSVDINVNTNAKTTQQTQNSNTRRTKSYT